MSAWAGSHYRVLQQESAHGKTVDKQQEQRAENQDKADQTGKNVEAGKQHYETVVKKIYVPIGCTFDADGVQRIQQRLDAGKAFRQSAGTLP